MKGTTEKAVNQKGGFLNNVPGPLMRVGSPLVKNIFTPLSKPVMIPLGSTAVASATYTAI